MLEYVSVNQIDPGKELYNKVKAGFIIKGTTLGAWCRQSGVKQQKRYVLSYRVLGWSKSKIAKS